MSTPAPTAAAGATLDEAAARRVLLVRAYESGAADDPVWTSDDRAWASRLARETVPAGTPPARYLDLRAQHALQRLRPRDAAAARLLDRRGWRGGWVVAALLLGALAGLAVDAIGSSQRINLLAPPVWGALLWNAFVYAGLAWPQPRGAKAWLVRRLGGRGPEGTARARFHLAWVRTGAPLLRARAALLLHAAAAALAAGLIGGLYLRGLVLDYRAGWQSTFLDAAQVRAALAFLLAPAVALTGIAVPDADALRALRVAPDALPVASAAPWIHLYATLLALFVVLPRTGLASAAALRAWRRARALALPLDEPYFERLLRERRGQGAQVQVLPLGTVATPHLLACLQAALAPTLGPALQLQLAPATGYGDEAQAATIAAAPGTTLRLALVDLAATPEDDRHGTFARALREAAPMLPLLVLADESAFRARFAALPARLAERRAAWQRWAQAQDLALVCIDLAQPDLAAAERTLQAALGA